MSRMQSKITCHTRNHENLNLNEEKAIDRCQHQDNTDFKLFGNDFKADILKTLQKELVKTQQTEDIKSTRWTF